MDDVTGRDPHRDLSAASRRVLETLTDAADVDGLTALGLETIAARADTSVRTVTRALTALRASGLIVQVRASKAHAPTVYRLTPDGSGHQGDDDYGLSVTEPTTGRSEIAEPARRLLIFRRRARRDRDLGDVTAALVSVADELGALRRELAAARDAHPSALAAAIREAMTSGDAIELPPVSLHALDDDAAES